VAETLREVDLRSMLDLLDAARSTDVDKGLPSGFLARAQELVPCDIVSFTEFDPYGRIDYLDQSVPAAEAIEASGEQTGNDDAFWHNYWDSLPCCYPDRSGDTRTITTLSDFYSDRQFHSTPLYAEYLGPLGIEHHAMLCLSAPAGRARRLMFFRGPGPEFDGRDGMLLALLRPHLDELYQDLLRRHHPSPDLTRRQWEILRLVASGHTNAEIARELFVSKETVRKHLENIFYRLGVTTRTAAVASAFPKPIY
jgi:DNA-binding CsgD family transcriptional regulator